MDSTLMQDVNKEKLRRGYTRLYVPLNFSVNLKVLLKSIMLKFITNLFP